MKSIKILSLFIMMSTLFQCRSLQLDKRPPFEITSATYQNWFGGQPGVSGINVRIIYKADKQIQFDSIYFSKKVAKLEFKDPKRQDIIFGYFNTSRLQNDRVLDANPTKEMNNHIPEIHKFPFELKPNQAVISYKFDGKTRFFKIKNLVKKQTLTYK